MLVLEPYLLPQPTPPTPVNPNLWRFDDKLMFWADPTYWMNGTHPLPATTPEFSIALDVYDELNGTMDIAWSSIGSTVPDSYNVYLNGVLNQNVAGLECRITGLQKASYNPATGILTPSLNYTVKVVAVVAGVETSASLDKVVTPNPTSVMLTTPMKRIWPFPSTGPW